MRKSTFAIIEPILTETYGDNDMSLALAGHLAACIDNKKWAYGRYRCREEQIMLTCWDWFSGGDTAAAVAKKIEAALKGAKTYEHET